MSEDAKPIFKIRAAVDALAADVDDMGTRVELLETENKAIHQQNKTLDDENQRLHARVQQLVCQLESALHKGAMAEKAVRDAAGTLVAGLNTLQPSVLRGSPQRPTESDPANLRVVRAGPQSA